MENLVVLDCEVYPNYTLFAFKNIGSNKTVTIDIKGENETLDEMSYRKLNSIINTRTTFGFNSRNYDIPIILFALKKKSASEIHKLSSFIINNNSHGWQTMKRFGLVWDKNKIDHFDIQEPVPNIRASLKLYGGRMHSKRLQDLPIKPDSILTETEMEEMERYCINDLDTTIDLYKNIKNLIDLRIDMSKQYDQDLRSKSDAQIAEALIKSELSKTSSGRLKAPKVSEDSTFRVTIPDFIKFETEQLQNLLEIIRGCDFKVDDKGSVILPSALEENRIEIGRFTYEIGVGGLHSNEKSQSIIPEDDEILIDKDVASYYPAIIINNNLYPKHLGENFLDVYKSIMVTRLKAKKEKNKIVNESLKIVLNGTYGKLGDVYSVMYSPDLLVTVTLIGQLSLLMLIEKLESRGISIVSANTDGFVSLVKNKQRGLYSVICFDWELITGFDLEETIYTGLFSRDVNNYFAITDQGIKRKGAFSANSLKKNPSGNICVDAVIEYTINKTPIEKTISECKDVTKFLFVRTVNGGATYKGDYLGRVVRWIYSTEGETIYYKPKIDLDLKETRNKLIYKYNLEKGDPILKIPKKKLKNNYDEYKGCLVFKTSTPKVSKSEGSRPIMEIEGFPEDIDYSRYIDESLKILTVLGLK